MSGHIHGYERMFPIYKEQATSKDYKSPQSTVYMVAGMAGNIEGHSATVTPKNYSAVYNNRDYGVCRMRIENQTHLLWEFIEAENASVVDSVWIHKGRWAS